MIELCKRLIHLHHHIHVTCIFPTIEAPMPSTLRLLESLPSAIQCTFLPPINKQDLPQDLFPLKIDLAISQSMPSIRDSLISLLRSTSNTPPVALVVDFMATQALVIAKELNLLSFIYFPLSAMSMSLLLHLPTLHEPISCEYKDHTEPIHLPGCSVPIRGQDLPSNLFHDLSSIIYEITLQHCKSYHLAEGVLANTFSKMEESTPRAFPQLVFKVGPIIQSATKGGDGSNVSVCVNWLGKQKPNTVLYVCFGSGGTLSQQQLNELALGLELSGQKFLWVLREPKNSKDLDYKNASIESDDLLKYLPHEFLERTKEQGLVVPLWAPQTLILTHTSTGGFLTHCGWNSILESIMYGVPVITWPLFADQRMNATLLTEGLKVGLKIKFNENNIAQKEEIAKVIRGLMMGEERNGIQQRIEELKNDAASALGEDGSSTRALSQFATQIENSTL